MSLDVVGAITAFDISNERPAVLNAVQREIFINEAPLLTRLPRQSAVSDKFSILRYDVRGRTFTVGTGGMADGSTTSLPIADASPFLVGDVLEIGTERLEVTADPNVSATPNVLTVRRGVEGTTAAAHTATTTVTLIGNSRTGAEIDQNGNRAVRTSIDQYVQTFEFPVQVGGKAEAIRNTVLPAGAPSVFNFEKSVKLLEMVRDIEYTSYYGIGEYPSARGDRAKQRGIKSLISAGTGGANVKTGAGASYTRISFIGDTIQKIYDAGGSPDTIICSTDFLSGLDIWVPNKTAYMGQTTPALGFPVKSFVLPLNAEPMTIIPSLQLAKGTAMVLSAFDLKMAPLREEQWLPRERRGDRFEGDWIADFAVWMGHPQWHAWVEGISSFA